MAAHTVVDFGHRLLNRLHRSILAVTGGRLGWRIGPMPVVELHTVGRTSGARRSVMLTAPVHDGVVPAHSPAVLQKLDGTTSDGSA